MDERNSNYHHHYPLYPPTWTHFWHKLMVTWAGTFWSMFYTKGTVVLRLAFERHCTETRIKPHRPWTPRRIFTRRDILATCLYCFNRGKNGGMMIDGTGKKNPRHLGRPGWLGCYFRSSLHTKSLSSPDLLFQKFQKCIFTRSS